MNNAKLLILALLLASLAATPALAQRHGWSATGDQDRRPGQRIEALTEQLDLTPGIQNGSVVGKANTVQNQFAV